MVCAGDGMVQSCFPPGDLPALNGSGDSVSTEELEPAGTQFPQWPRGQAGECHSPSGVRCQRLPAGTVELAPPSAPKDDIQTHHRRGQFPYWSFDGRTTDWGLRAITRYRYPMVGLCVWTGPSEHDSDAMKSGVAGVFSGPGRMKPRAQALYTLGHCIALRFPECNGRFTN